MRYSLELKYRKYVPGYGFSSFSRKFGDKYGKKITDSVTKTGLDAANTASKILVQKTAEATVKKNRRDLEKKKRKKKKIKMKQIKQKRFGFHQKRDNK